MAFPAASGHREGYLTICKLTTAKRSIRARDDPGGAARAMGEGQVSVDGQTRRRPRAALRGLARVVGHRIAAACRDLQRGRARHGASLTERPGTTGLVRGEDGGLRERRG